MTGITIADLAQRIGAPFEGNGNLVVISASEPATAGHDDLALAMDPKILILDEPTEGIQPNIVKQIEDAIVRLNRERGLGIILVEQNVPFARSASDRFLVLDKGRVALSGKSQELSDDVVEKHLTF